MGWHRKLQSHWNNTKSFIHQGYKTLGKWAGHVERGAGIGRKIFQTLAPILDDFGQGQVVAKGMQAIQNYDRLRGNVMDIDQEARKYGRHIGDADFFS